MGAFEQIIQALHRLMDLKEKYLDVEVYVQLKLSVAVSSFKVVGDDALYHIILCSGAGDTCPVCNQRQRRQ